MGDRWVEVADRVLVRRHAELDLSTGLVLGDGACLVVDTRGDEAQGAELAAAVREISADPWTVVLTHAHFDHSFGTAAFLPAPVWAQQGCRTELATGAQQQKDEWAEYYRQQGRPEIAERIAAVQPVLPDWPVAADQVLAIGGRRVELLHFGAGHTDHDLVVHVPDAGVVFAGDLVERGESGTFTAESFGADSDLVRWPAALSALLALGPRVVVPGHGEPVDAGFVAGQRDALRCLAELGRAVAAGELPWEAALNRSPLPAEATRSALARLI